MVEEVNPFAQYRNKSIVPLMDSSNTTMQNEDDNPYSKFRNRNILSSTKIEEVDVEPVVQNMEVGEYSANDLVEDKFYKPIENYMHLRFGVDKYRDYSREELINKFLNNMRGFSGGNSVRAINEIAFLNSYDPEDDRDLKNLEKIGEAYTIYEGMETLFGDTDFGEKMSILGDYTREAILDPLNLVGFGIGKLFSSGSVKVATRLAQKEAMKVYKKALANGAKEKAAKEAADKVWAESMIAASTKVNNDLVKRRVARNQTRGNNFLKVFKDKKLLLKEGIPIIGVDTTASIGTELAYQNGLIKTTDRESYDKFAVGIAAIGGMASGGIQLLSSLKSSRLGEKPKIKGGTDTFEQTNKALGTSDLALPSVDVATTQKGIAYNSEIVGGVNVSGLGDITKTMKKALGNPDWKAKVAQGRGLAVGDYGDTMWQTMIMGDKDFGITGLMQVMYEQGYVWAKRKPEDTISNFVSDAIRTFDPQDVKKFLKEFEEATGVTMFTSKEATQGKKLSEFTPEDFANSFAYWASRQGEGLNRLSQMEGALRVNDFDPTTMTLSKVGQRLFDAGIYTPKVEGDNVASDFIGTQANKYLRPAFEKVGLTTEGVRSGQNRLIRLLVSSPSTSYLNLIGWGSATTLNSITDMGLGLTFLAQGLGTKPFNKARGDELLRHGAELYRANFQRMRNLLNPTMTYDAYKSIVEKNPELLADLVKVLPGGVEDIDKLIKKSGFDPKMTAVGDKAEDFVEAMQLITLVKGQDVFTKSQEFVYQLDKVLRIGFGEGSFKNGFKGGWTDFFARPDAKKLMGSREYKEAVARASYETQRAIFSKSFKGQGFTGEVAGLIEDARNIPALGLLVPFGRFWNNTIAHSMDITGIAFMQKFLGKATGLAPQAQERSARELFVRGALGLGTIHSLADLGDQYREWGLSWDAEPDDLDIVIPFGGLLADTPRIVLSEGTGAARSKRYDFPKSHYLAAAQFFSYVRSNEEMPPTLINDIFSVVSLDALTRTLDQTTQGTGAALASIFRGETERAKAATVLGKAFLGQPISAGSRWAGWANDFVGLARGSDFKQIDRKQGSEVFNNAFRYIDQFLGATTGDLSAEKFSASIGDIRNSASKHLGVREVELTETAKVLNMIGLPQYLADRKTKVNVAGNRYNEIFHELLEDGSRKLLNSKVFREGDYDKRGNSTRLKLRQDAWAALKDSASKTVKTMMLTDAKKSGDNVLMKMLTMEVNRDWGGLSNIDKAIKNLKATGRLPEDLEFHTIDDPRQLTVIEEYLKYQKQVSNILTKMN